MPLIEAYSKTLLQHEPRATIIHADVRRIEGILSHPEVHRLLDFTRPVAVLVLATFHFVPDDAEVQHITSTIRKTIPRGSYVAISHGTNEGVPPTIIEQVEQLYQGIASPIKFRSEAEIRSLFSGLTLVEPGVVYGPLWRPEAADDIFIDELARSVLIGGIGQKI